VTDRSLQIWEALYQGGDYAPIVPYTEMLAFLARVFNKSGTGRRLLEVGCGTAQNLAFARWAMDFEVHGIDYAGSAVAAGARQLAARGLEATLVAGDATALPYPDGAFDAVVERAVLQQNDRATGLRMLGEMVRVLRPGGYLCCSLATEGHQLFGRGEYRGDGDFYNPEHDGMRHFFARRDVLEAFAPLELLRLSLHTRQDVLAGRSLEQTYVVEARKPEAAR
jgi:ubiquinone/menaquinone biosynthesis C-methylase UbiE